MYNAEYISSAWYERVMQYFTCSYTAGPNMDWMTFIIFDPSAGPVCLKCFAWFSIYIVQIYNRYCSIAGPNMDWMAIVIFDPSAGPVCLKYFACSSVYIVPMYNQWLCQVQGQCA